MLCTKGKNRDLGLLTFWTSQMRPKRWRSAGNAAVVQTTPSSLPLPVSLRLASVAYSAESRSFVVLRGGREGGEQDEGREGGGGVLRHMFALSNL